MNDRSSFRFEKAARANRNGDPVTVAQAARRSVGLGPEEPVRDVCRLLEDNGVKLLLLETNQDSFFGLSVGMRDGGPAVVVNTWDRISVERWIFTAAHELGHLLLHPSEYGATPPSFPCRQSMTPTPSPARSSCRKRPLPRNGTRRVDTRC